MKLPITKDQHTKIMPQILVVTFTLLLAALLYYFKTVWAFVETILSLATPFFAGFAIAFLLGPPQRRIESLLNRRVFIRKPRHKAARLISSLLAVLLLLAIIAVFLLIMLPQLIRSIESVVAIITSFLRTNTATTNSWLNDLLVKLDFLSVSGDELVVAWDNIVSRILENLNLLLDNIFIISSGIVNFLYNGLVAIITAFYILMDKDRLSARFKKVGYSLMKRSTIEELILWTRRANRIFSGFITGKIIDSAIIGIICYVGMLIFKMQYALLISCVIGVTNIIPFFGPFIGWIPCTLILLIVDPMSALWFSIFILVLQQLDGNVIGPHILGDYVGVSALSIMVAIVIGGGLFGFTGMLVSVPVYALGHAFIKTLLTLRLEKKGLPTDTDDYLDAPECLKDISSNEPTGSFADDTPTEDDDAAAS